MDFALGEGAQAAGYRVCPYEAVGSTSSEALSRLREGDPGRLWIVTDEQTAGRGRRGRGWETPKGNLAASLLVVLGKPAAAQAATLGFVAGLALHRALRRVAPDTAVAVGLDGAGDRAGDAGLVRFELKWPNDLLASGAKLAGIMLESESLSDGRLGVVVGIGVNVAAAPEGMPYPVTSLAALGVRSDAGELFRELAEAWVELAAIWDDGRGMSEIRRLWLSHGAGLGGPVALRIGSRVLSGTFETIDEAGRLVVRLPDGTAETVAAAEVHFGAVASAAAEA